MKELQIVKQVLPEIIFNFEEIKKSISEITAEYKNLVVTAETLPGCKKSQKELAHMRIEITKEGKRIEKIMSAPIKIFRDEVKEVVGLITDVEDPIKEGLEVFDEQRRQEKFKEIQEVISHFVVFYGLSEQYIGEIVIHDRFLNVTASTAEIKGSIETQVATLVDKQKRHIANKKMVAGMIENMNDLNGLNMKLDDFDLYFPNDWDEVSVLVSTINHFVSQQKKEKERLAEVEAEEVVVDTEPVKPEPVEPEEVVINAPKIDTNWQEVAVLMSEHIAGFEGGLPKYWLDYYAKKVRK